jgi:hypothetical protein
MPIDIINLTHVARALDRSADGLVAAEEFAAAGIPTLDPEALKRINEGGEQGDAITVGELARALTAERVAIVQDGTSKRLVVSESWSFPALPDLTMLEHARDAIGNVQRFNPNYPAREFEDHNFKGYKQVRDGDNPDGTPHYRTEAVYRWETNYPRLTRALRDAARNALDRVVPAQDPATRQAFERLQAAYGKYSTTWEGHGTCAGLYEALKTFLTVDIPPRPETTVRQLGAAIDKTDAAIADQERIVRDISPVKARTAINAEVKRLQGPTLSNFGFAGGLGAVAGAIAGAVVSGSMAIGSLPFIGVVAGVFAVGAVIGWVIAQSNKGKAIKQLEADLALLGTIDPAANRRELEQRALAAYNLMQVARNADFMAAVRSFKVDADQLVGEMGAIQHRAEEQTQSLRTVERWALKA